MRVKMSSRRALITAIIMSLTPTLLIAISEEKLSFYLVLIVSTIINWPIIRWLDDRQWYREWEREEIKNS